MVPSNDIKAIRKNGNYLASQSVSNTPSDEKWWFISASLAPGNCFMLHAISVGTTPLDVYSGYFDFGENTIYWKQL